MEEATSNFGDSRGEEGAKEEEATRRRGAGKVARGISRDPPSFDDPPSFISLEGWTEDDVFPPAPQPLPETEPETEDEEYDADDGDHDVIITEENPDDDAESLEEENEQL